MNQSTAARASQASGPATPDFAQERQLERQQLTKAQVDNDVMGKLLEEIATHARRLDRELYFFDSSDDGLCPEQHQLMFERLRDAINLIGWLADTGCGLGVRGDALDWLTCPAIARAARARVPA